MYFPASYCLWMSSFYKCSLASGNYMHKYLTQPLFELYLILTPKYE